MTYWKLNNSKEQKCIDILFSYFGKLKSEITNLVCQRSLWYQEGIPVPFLSQILVVFQSSCHVRQLCICPAFSEHIPTAYVMSLLHVFPFFIIRLTGCLPYVLIFIWHKITFTATGESRFHSIFCWWDTNNLTIIRIIRSRWYLKCSISRISILMRLGSEL